MRYLRNLAHLIYPLIAYLRYGRIGRKLIVIGVTGTDGKSSSVLLTSSILRAAGYAVAHYSSISTHDSVTETGNAKKMTTPGHGALHRFLHDAHQKGATHAIVEITSEGILQHRHRFIGFTLVVITNITPEHIEAHGGFERYRDTKLSLIRSLLPRNEGVILGPGAGDLADRMPPVIPVRQASYGSDGFVEGKSVTRAFTGTSMTLGSGNEEVRVTSKLAGPFASDAILLAAGIAHALGASLGDVKRGVESLELIPGRFEVVGERPTIIVDYAHTLAALASLLPYVREHTKGKLIHVFGAAGGGRDRYKRPLLAKLSEKYADASILTEENSFDEPTDAILAEIRTGFSPSHMVEVAERREDAVQLAYSRLSPDDTLLLTAKGSEEVIAGPNRSHRPYTERTYARCLSETSLSA